MITLYACIYLITEQVSYSPIVAYAVSSFFAQSSPMERVSSPQGVGVPAVTSSRPFGASLSVIVECSWISDACCCAETTCRSNLQRSSRRFRQIISSPDFEAFFGPAQPHLSGGRQNIFGGEDELRVAPKGVDKTHKCVSRVGFPY